jgi:hypothetical protein
MKNLIVFRLWIFVKKPFLVVISVLTSSILVGVDGSIVFSSIVDIGLIALLDSPKTNLYLSVQHHQLE